MTISELKKTGRVTEAELESLLKELTLDEKIFIMSGNCEKKKISMEVKKDDLAWYNPEKKKWETEEIGYTFLIGSSTKPEDLILRSSSIFL